MLPLELGSAAEGGRMTWNPEVIGDEAMRMRCVEGAGE